VHQWLGVAAGAAVLLSGAWTLGLLLVATFLAPLEQRRLGRLGAAARAKVPAAALVQAGIAVVAVPLLLTGLLGVGLGDAARPSVIVTYAGDLLPTRALFGVVLLALVVAGLVPVQRTVGGLVWATPLAAFAAALPGLTVPHGSINDHGLPFMSGALVGLTSSAWLGSVLALRVLARDLPADQVAEARRRLARAVPWLGVGLAYGLAGLTAARLPTLASLWTSAYGLTALAATLVAVTLAVAAVRSAVVVREAATAAALAVLALGVAGVALAVVLPPAGNGEGPRTLAEQLVGMALPADPPTVGRLLSPHLDSVMLTFSLLAGGLYLAGTVRLRRRGIGWPVLRTLSWLAGLGTVLLVTATGIGEYAMTLFSTHMLQHMVLTMLSPILLVLGAPVTLALRALKPAERGQRGPREWVAAALHSRPTVVLTNPVVALGIYLGSLYGLYFTGIFSWLMGSHYGHVFMLVHFLASGYLFFWTIIGTDPTPRPIPYPVRILDLLASMGVHAFFGVVVMMSTALVAGGWYGRVAPPWLASPLTDQGTGGGIAWAFGEIPSVLTLLALMAQWIRSEERFARRTERQAERDGDAELVAYNAQLTRLADRAAAGHAMEQP
jgi:cytochrome c oxidase assembly factor CtaG